HHAIPHARLDVFLDDHLLCHERRRDEQRHRHPRDRRERGSAVHVNSPSAPATAATVSSTSPSLIAVDKKKLPPARANTPRLSSARWSERSTSRSLANESR